MTERGSRRRRLWLAAAACIAGTAGTAFAAGRQPVDDDPNACDGGTFVQQVPMPPATLELMEPAARPAAPAGIVATQRTRQPIPWVDADREAYPDAEPEPVRATAEQPVSTFSADVDTAAYAVVRRFLRDGQMPPSDAVRVEELVNYFDYDYPRPRDPAAPFQPTVVVHPTPWNADTEIVHIGISGFDPYAEARPPANLVWLVDVSGSMDEPDKMPLVRRSLRLLAQQMGPQDTVSIVTYAGSSGIHLEPTSGVDRERIERAIRTLCPGGSTAGAEGLRTAYELAERTFDADAVNRILLATDGDFNVGVTDNERLEDYVAAKRETGIYLTVLGYGRGNYQDARMQVLAQAGNGVAAYIDGVEEAEKVLVDEMASTLLPIADDVKFQVEFNPARVAEYRLIGYETRLLDREDFDDDRVDAGDIGAGHEVTALYEIAAPGSAGLALPPLRYGAATRPATSGAASAAHADELGYLRIRYKLPGEDESRLLERPIVEADRVPLAAAGHDARFAAAVAAFAQILRREPQVGGFGMADVAALAGASLGDDPRGLRRGFLDLVALAAPMTE